MSTLNVKYNSELDKFKDIILFPSTYTSAVETLIKVPLPGQAPLTIMEKINMLLLEIERVNKHIEYYKSLNNEKKIADFQAMKMAFVALLQEIMEAQYEIEFYKKAA